MIEDDVASRVEEDDMLILDRHAPEDIEEVVFVARSKEDHDVLIWTESCLVNEPLVYDESDLVRLIRN